MEKTKKEGFKFEPGYMVVSLIAVLSIGTIGLAWNVFNKSQEIIIVDNIPVEVVSLPETGETEDIDDPEFTCDEFTEGKVQRIDSKLSVCFEGEWVLY